MRLYKIHHQVQGHRGKTGWHTYLLVDDKEQVDQWIRDHVDLLSTFTVEFLAGYQRSATNVYDLRSKS